MGFRDRTLVHLLQSRSTIHCAIAPFWVHLGAFSYGISTALTWDPHRNNHSVLGPCQPFQATEVTTAPLGTIFQAVSEDTPDLMLEGLAIVNCHRLHELPGKKHLERLDISRPVL